MLWLIIPAVFLLVACSGCTITVYHTVSTEVRDATVTIRLCPPGGQEFRED